MSNNKANTTTNNDQDNLAISDFEMVAEEDVMQRSMNAGNSQHNPLKVFGHAKKKMGEILKELRDYISDTRMFIADTDGEFFQSDMPKVMSNFEEKIVGIQEMVQRNHMKVVFFGRTSNGKSSVINTMLSDSILPSGIGHTTSCFLQVEASNTGEKYMLTEKSGEPLPVTSIHQLGSALSSLKLTENSLIRIFWPTEKCGLLKDDVLLVDSPGIDVTPDLDLWIDKYCLDADVFVLVCNAESTLMQTEKNFFLRVSDRLAKPNIFILNNRWDVTVDMDPTTIAQVKRQHLERGVEFLVNELKVYDTPAQAEGFVFFVAAKECLRYRTKGSDGLDDGFLPRCVEFEDFETKFAQCISKSALQTKFAKHTHASRSIVSKLRSSLTVAVDESERVKRETGEMRDSLIKQLELFEQDLSQTNRIIKQTIEMKSEEVERKVSAALSVEIRRLHSVVNSFVGDFNPNVAARKAYKTDLNAHVEAALGKNLESRCSAALVEALHKTEIEIAKLLSSILPGNRESTGSSNGGPASSQTAKKQQPIAKELNYHLTPPAEFSLAYHIDCRNLCAEFHEDITFHYSLAPSTLLRRFLGVRTSSVGQALGDVAASFNQRHTTPRRLDTPSGSHAMTPSQSMVDQSNEELGLFSPVLAQAAMVMSRSAVGVCVFGFVVIKVAGWRILGIVGTLYGAHALYEYMSWTHAAQERALKSQYAEFAGSKLRVVADLTSASCAHQVQQQLNSTFSRMSGQVTHTHENLQNSIAQSASRFNALCDVYNRAKLLKNRSTWLENQLSEFSQKFLNDTSVNGAASIPTTPSSSHFTSRNNPMSAL